METPSFPEFSICAAIRTAEGVVVRGHHHPDCIDAGRRIRALRLTDAWETGFVTSRNRFLPWKGNFMRRYEPGTVQTGDPTVPEVCVCAASRTVQGKIILGQTHDDCMRTIERLRLTYLKERDGQGFVTTLNRFVDRAEGKRLQLAAGIASARPGGYKSYDLHSEDLY